MSIDRKRGPVPEGSQFPVRVIGKETEVFGFQSNVVLRSERGIDLAFARTLHHDLHEPSEWILMPGLRGESMQTQAPFAVASGIGGVGESAYASNIAVKSIRDTYLYSTGQLSTTEQMSAAISNACNAIKTTPFSFPDVGASLAMIDFNTGEERTAVIASIGDARVYKYDCRKNRLATLTADDKLVYINNQPVILPHDVRFKLTRSLAGFEPAITDGAPDSIDRLITFLTSGDNKMTRDQATDLISQWVDPAADLFQYLGSVGASVLPRRVNYQSGDLFILTTPGISDLVTTNSMLEIINKAQDGKPGYLKRIGINISEESSDLRAERNWPYNASQGLLVIQAA